MGNEKEKKYEFGRVIFGMDWGHEGHFTGSVLKDGRLRLKMKGSRENGVLLTINKSDVACLLDALSDYILGDDNG